MFEQHDKLELFQKTVDFFESADLEDEDIYDSICDFFVENLEFQSVVFFKVFHNDQLLVLGRSGSARKNFVKGSRFNCIYCPNLKNREEFDIASDARCEITISDHLIYESCVSFRFFNDEIGFIKLAQNSPFSQDEFEFIKGLVSFIKFIFEHRGRTDSFDSGVSSDEVITTPKIPEVVPFIISKLEQNSDSVARILSGKTIDQLSAEEKIKILSAVDLNTGTEKLVNDLNEFLNTTGSPEMHKIYLRREIENISDQSARSIAERRNKLNVEYDTESEIIFHFNKNYFRYLISKSLSFMNLLGEGSDIHLNILTAESGSIKILLKNTNVIVNREIFLNIHNPQSLEKLIDLGDSELTGISFLLMKKYLDACEGSLRIENMETIPVLAITIPVEIIFENRDTWKESEKMGMDNTNILVIEDDYTTSKLLNNYLHKWGYTPVIVNTPEKVFEKLNEGKYLAAILDIEIPNCNGLELLKKIHEHPSSKSMPIVACSVEPEEQRVFLFGAVEYLVKPINHANLVEILQNYRLKRNSKILIVDDDLPAMNLISESVELAGFQPVSFSVSAEAAMKINQLDIDLAVIDLDMPSPDGFELIKIIKSERRFENLPIVIYTGTDDFEKDLKKIDGLFDELLLKRSTKIEELADTIKAMIDKFDLPPDAERIIQKESTNKILFAEDYKHSQIIVTRLLRKNGFNDIIIVENGVDAIKFAEKEKFALILMDMQMPVLDGFDAIKKLRTMPEHKDTPIIALTAFALQGDKEKCFEAGASDYLPKPIDSKEFIQKIRNFIQT